MSPSSRTAYDYVETSSALDALTSRVRAAPRIVLDIEGNSLYRYVHRVCLIQLALDGKIYIVDPLAEIDLSGFLNLLAEKTLVFHAGDYDLRLLRQSMDFEPAGRVFDTMLAAQLLGCEKLGLVALVEQFLGVQLSKQGKHGQKSNWARRPLSPAQLQYAADDVRYLGALADRLERELEALGRLEWHAQMCERMVQSALQPNGNGSGGRDPWRIKGLSGMKPKELAFVRALWHWRENEAREADRPPFKIMGNHQIIDLAVWGASRRSDAFAELPRLPRHCKGPRLDALRDALRKAHRMPKDERPQPPTTGGNGPPCPDHRVLVDHLRSECARVAEQLGVAPSVLAPRSMLVAVARAKPKTIDDLMQINDVTAWQARELGPRILEVLEGRR